MLPDASQISNIIAKLCAGTPHAQFERGLHGNGPAATLVPRHKLPMLYYQITMQTGFALSVNPNTTGAELVLAASNVLDDNQLWGLSFVPSMGGFAMLNKATNQYAKAVSNSNSAAVIGVPLRPDDPLGDPLATWTLSGAEKPAVRPVKNSDLNLNARGEKWGPGTPIIIHSWDGGDPNERWSFTFVKDAAAPTAKVASGAG